MKFVVVLALIVIQMTLAFRTNALADTGIMGRILGRDHETDSVDKRSVAEWQTGSNDYYIGCFKDDASRHFQRLQKFGYRTSLAECRNYCSGYKFVSMQASDWCLCGNALYKEGYPLVSDAECNLPCLGERGRMCGDRWRNSIYFMPQ